MRAVFVREPGGVDVLEIREVATPEPGPEELLVRNFATALNRADLLQRRGLYPPPAGASPIPGLEFAGEVARAGTDVVGFRRGDRVFGLVPGGGYGEFLCVHHRLALPIPEHFSFDAAAAVPEAFSTAYEGVVTLGHVRRDNVVVIHAAASGVGTAAIQLARAYGARVVATAGSYWKLERCRELGAVRTVDYHEESFDQAVRVETNGEGADLILDLVGAGYWAQNVRSLRVGGTLLVVGLLGGTRVEVDLGELLRKRLTIVATSLRGRGLDERIALAEQFRDGVLPLLESGEVAPVIDQVVPFEEVREAHVRMEENRNVGKIVLRL